MTSALLALAVSAVVAADSNLQLRQRTERGIAESGPTLPRDAIRVFVYEGTPRDVNVTEKQIAARATRSAVGSSAEMPRQESNKVAANTAQEETRWVLNIMTTHN